MQELYEEIDSESESERDYLNQLHSAPRNAKAAKKEWKKRLNGLRKSHLRYTNKSRFFGRLIDILLLPFLLTVALATVLTVWFFGFLLIETVPVKEQNFLRAYYHEIDSVDSVEYVIYRPSNENESFEIKKIFTYLSNGSLSLVALWTVFFIVLLSLRLTFLWAGMMERSQLRRIIADGKLPIYTPENRSRQQEIDRIAKELKLLVHIVVKDGNILLTGETKTGKISQDMLDKMRTIESINTAAKRLSLRGQIKAANKSSFSVDDALALVDDALAIVGVVLMACVAIAAMGTSATEYEVTYPDGTTRREWR
jgi:hypothetical protein